MTLIRTLTAGFAAIALMTGAAHASGYMKVGDIKGESTSAGDEHEIEFDIAAAKVYEGRKYANITLKRGITSSALEEAAKTRAVISWATIVDDSTGKTVRYELENCRVTSYSVSGATLSFETVKIHYVVQDEDHSAADRPTEEVAFYYNKASR